ncbi:Uncharacterised protein [Mycobacteroides abscessus subsp. massiliense]|uniref:hypothetical protein n=1 Tax=Mycobacteroides abscessus TaxID=36809 RepID=UPI00092BECE0|nr:hypothetical protein [Mycobacteroides abscessus]QSM02768.1 RepA-like replication initiator [Mycobacterium phage prophi88-1]QSM03316.1 RepA-like replication initiator [Mycobacterium phage prophi43-6]MBN7559811.1 hypothetical protein [Mycobacteroides abscessus subsp. abscessus]QSN24864.1 hypothetical protein I3U36_18655 [Mycobacteroides abscessus subsp. abscessus]QSN30066.1 hypothetical protein I3U42_18945 [Mycobacteroides abscessus subsp. abscessus]
MTTREYAKNLFAQWSDDDFCNQPIFDKLFFQVLNGQRAVNAAGIQPINFTRWRKAMRDGEHLPAVRDLQAALVRMERRGFVFTDEDTGEVLVRSRIRRDELDKQPTMFLAALRLLAVIDSPKFAAVLADELDRMDVPEVKGDKDYAKRLRDSLNDTHRAARLHLKTLADGYPQPFPEPFDGLTEGPSQGPTPRPSTGPSEGPTSGGSTGPTPRPGETGPTPGPSPRPTQGPSGSGSGSGSGSLTLVTTQVGGTRARAHETAEPTPAPDEPPTRCKAHRDNPDAIEDNCGPCANFRKAHERWTEHQTRAQAQARADALHQAAQLRAHAIAACDLCDPDGYLPGTSTVCNHNPTQAETNARGRQLVHAALRSRTQQETDDA